MHRSARRLARPLAPLPNALLDPLLRRLLPATGRHRAAASRHRATAGATGTAVAR